MRLGKTVIFFDHEMEGIGIALDIPGDRMFLADLADSVYTAKLDGSDKRPLLGGQWNHTGIAFADIDDATPGDAMIASSS